MDHPETGELNRDNRFVEELRRCLPDACSVLDICSDPNEVLIPMGSVQGVNMTRLDISGNAAKCGIFGHQEAGQDSDQDFIYLPRKHLPFTYGGVYYEEAGPGSGEGVRVSD